VEEVEVSLAFRWGARAADVADRLEADGLRALFLLTTDELREQDDLVRRLVAAGHTVGLAVTGDDPEDCLAQAQEGAALLAHIARCSLQILSADGLDQAGRQVLADAGCALWSADAAGEASSARATVLRALLSSRVNRVELSCSEEGFALAVSLLRTFTSENYQLVPALAPSLQGG
jgi:hypothetical protein